MRYPGYRIEHFTRLSFKEGGVTRQQLEAMYHLAETRLAAEKELEFKFYANLHGFDLDANKKDKKSSKEERKLTKEELIEEARNSAVPVFRDPSYYDHLTQEDREELTQIMMAKHRYWRDNQLNVPGIKGG